MLLDDLKRLRRAIIMTAGRRLSDQQRLTIRQEAEKRQAELAAIEKQIGPEPV